MTSFRMKMVLGTLCLALNATSCWGQSIATQAFLEEYRRALPALESRYGQAIAEGDLRTERILKGVPDGAPAERHLVYAAAAPRYKLVVIARSKPDIESTGYSEMAFVERSGRDFVVSRTREGAAWQVNSLGDFSLGWKMMFLGQVNGIFQTPLAMLNDLNSELFSSPRFHLTASESFQRGGGNFVRLSYEIKPKGDDPGYEGSLVLEPSRGWIMHEYSLTTRGPRPRTYSGAVTYATSESGELPYPSQVVQKEVMPGGQEEVSTFTFESYSHQPVPEATFTLADFGLGELDLPAPKPSNSAVWWAVAAIAALVGVFVTRSLASKYALTT